MNGKGLKQFLVIVRSTVHLRSPIQKSLLLLLLLLLFLLLLLLLLLLLKERDTGSFIVNRPVRLVVHVRVIEIREFRLEGLHQQKSVNITERKWSMFQTIRMSKRLLISGDAFKNLIFLIFQFFTMKLLEYGIKWILFGINFAVLTYCC